MSNYVEVDAQEAGGDLVSIHSAEENAAVVSLLAAASPRYVAWTWTGGQACHHHHHHHHHHRHHHQVCQPATGECTWTDGTPWDYSNWDAGPGCVKKKLI